MTDTAGSEAEIGEQPVPAKHARRPWRTPVLLLAGIFAIALFHMLYIAKALFLPIVLALLASFALTPIVRAISNRGVPTPISAALVVLTIIGLAGLGIAALATPAVNWIERAPSTLREIEHKLRPVRAPVERIARATRDVQNATEIEDGSAEPIRVGERSYFSQLVLQTQGVAMTLSATLVLLFFLLASRDGLVRALASLPSGLVDQTRARQVVEEIETDISQHLLTITLINVGLGIAVAGALFLLGMPNPALWGAMATILNFVPFLGAVVGLVIVSSVALISFDDPMSALAVGLTFSALTATEGLFVTPAILGRRLTLSPVAVFLCLMLWSYVWGIPGALIAVPVLALVKITLHRAVFPAEPLVRTVFPAEPLDDLSTTDDDRPQ